MQKFRLGKDKKREMETGGKEKKGGREVGRIQRNLASSSPNTGHMLISYLLTPFSTPLCLLTPLCPCPHSCTCYGGSRQLWAWSLLLPGGPSGYCQCRCGRRDQPSMGGSVWGRHLVQEAERKRGALRPRGSGGLQQGAGGRGEVGGVCVCVCVCWGGGGGEPSGTLVASETASAITTEMASQSQGIQQLLQAEKRAAEKVADARKRKARRLKQAKEEAQMEVEQYRREREQEFQSKQQAAMGSQGNLSAEVEQATRRQVQGMQSSQQRNRERVLAQLLGMVCDVRPQVHPNYRIAV